MAVKIGVLLAGCGVYDGSEIHEATLTLLFLQQNKADILCTAPDMEFDVVNHRTQEPTGEKRNALTESARIARGDIQDLATVSANDFDGLIVPGGFGAAKNLSNFAVKGPDAEVHPEVKRILTETVDAGKPLGAICIAPATVAAALGDRKPEVTIGNDAGTAAAIEKTGAVHSECPVEDIRVDARTGIVSTPAYMLGPGIADVAVGIEKLVKEVIRMAEKK